jgi:predicted lipid-binding transport protein (Tim44 family)
MNCTRLIAAALIAVAGAALAGAPLDADAARIGGGGSIGRQSPNVMHQRPAATPPAATSVPRTAAPAATAPSAASGTAAAGAAARTGGSRWLGPLAGIAAGLGIGALLSHFGMGGAFGDFLVSALLAGLVVFAVMAVLRRLRGAGGRSPVLQGAPGADHGEFRQPPAVQPQPVQPMQHFEAAQAAPAAQPAAVPKADDDNWFVPGDFDTARFLQQAKTQFVSIQALWDTGDVERLREYLTDELIAEIKPQFEARSGAASKTEVVLLNAELLGIESVSGGHLASVRYSGMLREQADAEAFRFEEVWNLFKPAQGGWLLAGIQQIPVEYAS